MLSMTRDGVRINRTAGPRAVSLDGPLFSVIEAAHPPRPGARLTAAARSR
jgi:hypothetical protein